MNGMFAPYWKSPEARPKGLAIFAILALTLTGCQKKESVEQLAIDREDATWVLSSTDKADPTPALLWNGSVGIRIGRDGRPNDLKGKPLPAFSIESYEQSGEEKIIPLKDWHKDELAPPAFDLREVSGYQQTLNLKSGILETSWVSTDRGQKIRYFREAILDPTGLPIWAERLTVKLATTVEAKSRSDKNLRDQTDQSQYIPREFDGGEPPKQRFTDLEKAAELYYKEFWSTDIEIDGPEEDQRAIRSFLYYLRSSIDPESNRSISPMGLSSSTYFGHVFWDADIWVFPALALLDPDRAKVITDYRIAMADQARKNYLEWVKAGRPTGKPSGIPNRAPAAGALKYPWESSVTGRETVPGSSKYQDHITGSVAFALRKAGALGLAEMKDVNQIGRGAAAFFLDRATGDPTKELSINGTMSPDEHFIGNNDLYTNLLAQFCVDNYAPGKGLFMLPRDEKSLLTYDGDKVKSYKQAAAVLSIYPLQNPEAEKNAKVMMSRFSDKVIKNGPAMTDSIHSIIYARMGQSEEAYKAWHRSWKDFADHPLMLFSEKRNSERTYFTTGAGGCLQAVLFGFAGLRIDTEIPAGFKKIADLKSGYVLSAKPNLPKAWKSMRIRGLTVLGSKGDLIIEGDQVSFSSKLTP